jgi:hypothetical protein
MCVSVEVKRIDLVTDGTVDPNSKVCDLFSGGTEFEFCLGRKLTFVR